MPPLLPSPWARVLRPATWLRRQPAVAAPGNDLTAQLEQLASLKQQGILSDEEFTAAKAKLLGT